MAIPTIGIGWLVGWLVNLANQAKIVISERIWLRFGMDINAYLYDIREKIL